MLWSQTHRYFDHAVYERLRTLKGLNVLVHGPEGCSKHVYVQRFVDECIGISCEDWKWNTFVINDDKKTEVSLFIRQSRLHNEFCLNEFTSNQKHFVRCILKPLVKNLCISNNGSLCSKLIVIYNVELLSNATQSELRTLTEKYVNHANFVFVTSRIGEIIPTIQSNTIPFRVCRPTNADLLAFIKNVMKIENETVATRTINQYIEANENQPVKVLNSIQLHVCKIPNDLDKHIHKLCEHIQAGKFKLIREVLYVLMVKNVSPIHIIKSVVLAFQTHEVARYGAIYSHKIVHSERVIYQLEAFVNHCVGACATTNKSSRRTKHKKEEVG